MSAQLSLPGVKWPPPPRPPPRLPEKRLPRPIAPILGSPPAIKQQRGMCGRAREFVRRHRAAGAHRLARTFRLSVDRSNGLRHSGDRVQQRLRPRNRRRWVDWFHCRKEGGGNFGGVSLINLPLIRLNRRTLLKFHCDLPECMEARQSLCRGWETPAIDVACFGNCCWHRGVRKDFRQNRRLFLPVNSARARAFTFNKSLKDRVAGVTTLTLERAKLQVR